MNSLRIADPRSARPRDQLGRYELVRELVFGRQCSVYLARSQGEGRANVVIKRMRDAFPDDLSRARMLREGRVGLGLRLPQLVRVLEIHDHPELFLVMEYVDGERLSELLARTRGKDVLRFVVSALLDALCALSSLHGYRDETGAPGYLVHQAPSARHLLVGLDGVTRLVDLSNLHGPTLGPMPQHAYTLLESEQSPEHVERAAIDPRCDLYVLGTVLSHSLVKAGRRDVPGLLQVSQRAIALCPSARYWSADEMAHALRFAAAEAGLLATRAEVARWVRSSRASALESLAAAPAQLPPPDPALPVQVVEAPSMQRDERCRATSFDTVLEHQPVNYALSRARQEQPPLRAHALPRRVYAHEGARGTLVGFAVAEPGACALVTQQAEDASAFRPPLGRLGKRRVALAGAAIALSAALGTTTFMDRDHASRGPAAVDARAVRLAARPPSLTSAAPVPALSAAPVQTPPPPAQVLALRSLTKATSNTSAKVSLPTAAPRLPRADREGAAVVSEPAPTSTRPAREEELVLHEPVVLFYDDDDPNQTPRIGIPGNPF
jgi:serine/threonine protein kinase